MRIPLRPTIGVMLAFIRLAFVHRDTPALAQPRRGAARGFRRPCTAIIALAIRPDQAHIAAIAGHNKQQLVRPKPMVWRLAAPVRARPRSLRRAFRREFPSPGDDERRALTAGHAAGEPSRIGTRGKRRVQCRLDAMAARSQTEGFDGNDCSARARAPCVADDLQVSALPQRI
jgi:hypothetical protein